MPLGPAIGPRLRDGSRSFPRFPATRTSLQPSRSLTGLVQAPDYDAKLGSYGRSAAKHSSADQRRTPRLRSLQTHGFRTHIVDEQGRTEFEIARASRRNDLLYDLQRCAKRPTKNQSSSRRGPNTYQHRFLSHNDEIRLVKIVAGYDYEPIQCEILHFRLDDPDGPDFTALSYVWGQGNDRYRVTCDATGATLDVTKNCYDALFWLRQESRDRLIWIDSMCIDQLHVEERNHQVLLMKSIYGKATSVLIFLGFAQSSSADEILEKIQAGDESLVSSWTLNETDSVKSLLRLPYWRRMWVLQEIYAAKAVQVMCNGRLYEEDILHKIISIRMAVLDTPLWFSLPLTVLIRGSTGQLDLWTLLVFTRTFNSSDGRDKIIALLGLVEHVPDSVKEILADYNCTEIRLMQRVVLYFFLQVIRMSVDDSSLKKTAWMRLLDCSYLKDEPRNGPENHHILHLEPTAKKSNPPTDIVVAVSGSLTLHEFRQLWHRCHDFLDIELPFNKVITFGGILRNAIETKTDKVNGDPVHPDEDIYIPRFRLAVTANGSLHAVPRTTSVGDVMQDVEQPITLFTPFPSVRDHLEAAFVDEEGKRVGEMLWSSNVVVMH